MKRARRLVGCITPDRRRSANVGAVYSAGLEAGSSYGGSVGVSSDDIGGLVSTVGAGYGADDVQARDFAHQVASGHISLPALCLGASARSLC